MIQARQARADNEYGLVDPEFQPFPGPKRLGCGHEPEPARNADQPAGFKTAIGQRQIGAPWRQLLNKFGAVPPDRQRDGFTLGRGHDGLQLGKGIHLLIANGHDEIAHAKAGIRGRTFRRDRRHEGRVRMQRIQLTQLAVAKDIILDE